MSQIGKNFKTSFKTIQNCLKILIGRLKWVFRASKWQMKEREEKIGSACEKTKGMK